MKLRLILSGVMVIAISAFSFNISAQTKKPAAVKKKAPSVTASKAPLASAEDVAEGKVLISKSDCMACHSIENKMVGPSYISVSAKYPLNQANVSALSKKIINGGSGSWGTIPMIAHPTLSSTDADKMVKYILSLKAGPAGKS
jgi:cytochrome c